MTMTAKSPANAVAGTTSGDWVLTIQSAAFVAAQMYFAYR
jgi:hypothetical protein